MDTKPKSKLSAILDVVLPAVFAVLAIMAAVKTNFSLSLLELFMSDCAARVATKGVFLFIAGMLVVLEVVSIRLALARK
jgi:hypothetical protein